MSDGSNHTLRYVAESTYGTTPATPALAVVRNTGTTLGLTKEAIQSAEIRGDRQISDLRHGARQVGGDISLELSYGSFDPLLEAALGGTWAAKATKTATTISAAAADNSYNDSGNGFVTAGFEVGDKITVTGFTGDVANNITSGVITAVTAGKITIGGTDGDVIVDDAAGESVTITTRDMILKSGTTRRSFTFERYFGDIESADSPYHRFTGCEVNTLALQVSANAIITGTLGIIGKDLTLDTAAIAGATYPAVSTTAPLDSFTGAMTEGGGAVAVVTEIQLNLDNGMAARYVVGSKTTIHPSIGRSNITGTVTVFFEDADMLLKFINETESSMAFTLPDGAGNKYTFTVPRLKYSGGQPDVGGEGPITLAMPFQALRDATTGSNIVIKRTPA